jgi:cation/acetate symporter
MLAPCLIIIVAEAALGGKLVGYFLPPPQALGLHLSSPAFFLILVLASIFLTVVLGGMRSATWTQCVQFVVLLGILAPLVAVSVIRTKLPLPQLTYGSQLEEVKALEQTKGIVTVTQPQTLSEVLPKPGAQPVVRPVERAFSALRPMDFLLLVFCLATGVAAHPAFLPRLSMTPTILASRRCLGWVTVVAGFVVLTIPAYAFFTKAMVVEALIGVPASESASATWAHIAARQSIRFFQRGCATRDVSSGQPRAYPATGRKPAKGFLRSRRGIGPCRALRVRRRPSRRRRQYRQR